ncbi:hypothetical protein BD410DRAFT_786211 [Rickenella mellea]|uniref:F-box domain-containing protein n=1 Tax=Rickenella mellea TaxID=50990 RepID=A0A4Y7Q954_9AGAM|nr:hypothetical protein BD410DRAFT_786211 [Rickenella mellea]
MNRLASPMMLSRVIPVPMRRRKFGIFKQKKVKELPVELLVEIFLYCLPTDGFPTPSRREAPILLGRVCRAWRAVSLATPRLWTQINLTPFPDTPYWTSKMFHQVGIFEWMRWSADCPLSFEIGSHIDRHDAFPLLPLTLQYEAHRWKAVHLRSTCFCVSYILDMLLKPGKTPMLTEIRFLNEEPFRDYPISCAPQLISIHLRAWYPSFLYSGKFAALRELRINPCENTRNIQAYSSMLAHCPSLKILEIVYPSLCLWGSTKPRELYIMRHLHTIILGGHNQPLPLKQLSQLDTPVLHSLAVSLWGPTNYPSKHVSKHLSTFLMRCGSQLQRLKVAGDFMSCSDLVECLRHTPLLQSLAVESIMLGMDLSTLCPRLVHFDVLWTRFWMEQTIIAVDVVVKRWKESRSGWSTIISPATLRVDREYLPAVLRLQEITECMERGMRVTSMPFDKECWWASHVPMPDLVSSGVSRF